MSARITITLLMLLISAPNVYACAMPRSGPDFDALIVVSGPHEDGNYQVSLPRKLAGYENEPQVRVEYAEQNAQASESPPSSPEPGYSTGGETIVMNLPADELDGRRVSVKAYWPPNAPGLCGVLASRSIGDK